MQPAGRINRLDIWPKDGWLSIDRSDCSVKEKGNERVTRGALLGKKFFEAEFVYPAMPFAAPAMANTKAGRARIKDQAPVILGADLRPPETAIKLALQNWRHSQSRVMLYAKHSKGRSAARANVERSFFRRRHYRRFTNWGAARSSADSQSQPAVVLLVLGVHHGRRRAAVRSELEGEPRLVGHAIEELGLGGREDLEHWIIARLGEQAVALPRHRDDEVVGLVVSDQSIEPRRIEHDRAPFRLYRKLGIDQVKDDVVDGVPVGIRQHRGAAQAVARPADTGAGPARAAGLVHDFVAPAGRDQPAQRRFQSRLVGRPPR